VIYGSIVMARRIRTVAIVGGGPAGATLGAFVARAGVDVTIFAKRKRPPLIVGESLVPAIVPFLRELGIEDEVRGYAMYKPGATWVFDGNDRMSFRFTDVRKAKTTYSYNVPRDRFDASVLAAAARAGARIVEQGATIEREPDGERVHLSAESLAELGADAAPPDLIVDATGRTRLVAGLLRLPTRHGDRRDTALFAHLTGVPVVHEGHVHTDRLRRGWAWRIPLPGRVSVGLVVNSDHIATFGSTTEEQYENYLQSEPLIRSWGHINRVTPVLKYSNYQLVSERGVGNGWALLGDAFGFVDPVFSSGLLIALDSARSLANAILAGSPLAFRRYERRVLNHVHAWQRVVGYFYDGRLFTLLRVGQEAQQSRIGRLIAPHFDTHLPRVFTGEATTNHYSLGLLSFMCEHALGGRDPSKLRVH
jgi:flavin-dependent dehydrogenase